MAFDPTVEQEAAMTEQGNILVAAAAGSGKTAVLVERVVKRLTDPENPARADRLLIVTFTNAAAAEMQSRIRARLDEECRKHPDDVALIRQRQLLNSAKICTIDSFCIDLVRENFSKLGVSPDFKVSDGKALKAIDEAVLSRILNRYFEENNAVFLKLLDTVGAEYDDGNFASLILRMYEFSRQMTDPDTWFRSLPQMYVFDRDNRWYAYAIEEARRTAAEMQGLIARAVDLITADETVAERYLTSFVLAAEQADALAQAAQSGEWDSVRAALNVFLLPKLPDARGKFAGLPETLAAKNAWGYLKKDVEALSALFYADTAEITAQCDGLSGQVALLAEILEDFQTQLFDEYKQRNTFTFHNTEHLALALLRGDGAAELAEQYDEVMVDEYQDTNDLQDALFSVLSGGGKRLFAVGDVKQSIYGFRGANPANFLQKKDAAVPYLQAQDDEPKKIILGKNFRCKAEVCDYVNFFFQNLMTEKTGRMVYGEEERLIPGATYPAVSELPVRLDLISADGNTEAQTAAEAAHIAACIRSVMAAGACIKADNETLRPARFSDFVILLRSAKNKAPQMAQILRNNGIPVHYSVEGYAESYEVVSFLSLLQVIDNPDSDIALLAALLSPIFGFTADETAKLRINKRDGGLYSALIAAAKQGDAHCTETLKLLEKYRLLGVTLPLPRFLSRLLSETDYLNAVSASEDGERRRNNLLLLVSYAEQYAADNAGGVGGFVQYILKQSEKGLSSAAAPSGGDCVRIMTIHASKGLQFPVCIVADTAAKLGDKEERENINLSETFGVGFRYYDEERGEKRTTVAREVIVRDRRRAAAEEELRLLYVAMTRTQDKLLFTAVMKDAEKAAEKAAATLQLSESRADLAFRRFHSYADWLLLTALLHPDGAALRGSGSHILPVADDSHIDIRFFSPDPTEEQECATEETTPEPNPALVCQLQENLRYEYPYQALLNIESKSSVSALANKAESEKYAFSARPSFMSAGGITAAERGTAIHKIMEFIDFDKADALDSELRRLYEWQFISEREAKAADLDKLRAFFESDLFARIKRSSLVKREMRFLTELPATVIDPSLGSEFAAEQIIVQGAVDLCFEESDGIVVVDFKTDRVTRPEDLTAAYGEQLAVYALACEKIFEKPVREKIIYSFALAKEIRL